MIHLPFIAGLIAGAAAVSALRSERGRALANDTGARLRSAYDDAESGVRSAARSGFDMLRGATSKFVAPERDEAGSAAQADKPEKAARPSRWRTAAAAKTTAAKTMAGKAGTAKSGTTKSGTTKSRRTSPKAAAAKAEAGGGKSEV